MVIARRGEMNPRVRVQLQNGAVLKRFALGYLMVCSMLIVSSGAGERQRPNLPAAANWAIHLDADRLRTRSLGKALLAELGKDGVGNDLNALKAVSRLGLGDDFQSLSLFGINDSGLHALVQFKGSFDTEALLAKMRSQAGYESLEYKGHAVQRWQAVFNGTRKHVYGAFSDEDTVLISLSGRMMQASLEALKLTPQSALVGSALVVPALSGSTFLAGVARPMVFQLDSFGGGAFKQVGDIRLTLGQTGERVAGTLTVDAGTREAALKLKTIAQGMILVATLAHQKDPDLATFAQSLSVRTRNRQMDIVTSASVSDLLAWWRNSLKRSK